MKKSKVFVFLGVLVVVFSSAKLFNLAAGIKVGHIAGIILMASLVVVYPFVIKTKGAAFFSAVIAVSVSMQAIAVVSDVSLLDGKYSMKYYYWIVFALMGYAFTACIGLRRLERTLKIATLAVFCAVFLKNLVYVGEISQMLLSSADHPRSPWNFFNVGYNINSEVTWLCLLSFLFAFKSRLYTGIFVYALVNALVSYVIGALLLNALFLAYVVLFRFSGLVRNLLLLALTAVSLVLALSVSLEQADELGSGRIDLWALALGELSQFSGLQFLFGLGHGALHELLYLNFELLDFHNVWLNLLYEGGVVSVAYFALLIIPSIVYLLKNASRTGGFDVRLSLVVTLVIINGLFTPRPLDLLFAFLAGAALCLSLLPRRRLNFSDLGPASIGAGRPPTAAFSALKF
ncbi:MAG: hypothetical protein AAGI11_15780 [Pseudomonadota bacterium]